MKEAAFPRLPEIILASLLLAVLLMLFFWPAIFGGRALLPTDLIYQLDPLWQPLAPEGFTFPGNQLLIDQVYQFYPWKQYAMRSLAAGRVPLWNPFINGGQPFLANGQSALFSPFNVLSYLASLSASFAVAVLLRLFVAGLFTYLLVREIGGSAFGAALAMLAFTFSGPILVWIGYAIGNVAVWLPALLFFGERMLQRQSWGYAIAASLVVGFQFLGGQPEMSFHLILLWLSYSLYRLVRRHGWRPSHWLPSAYRIAFVALVGLAMAAITLLPFVAFALDSEILSARAGVKQPLLRALLLDWHDWPSLVLTLLPRYLGTPTNGSYWYPYGNYSDYTLYVGVLPLVLAVLAVLLAYKGPGNRSKESASPPVAFWAATAVISLGVSLHLPVFNLVNRLPVFNLIMNGRFLRSVYALAVALLAGVGLDHVRIALANGATENRSRAHGFRLLTLMMSATALFSLLTIVASYGGIVALRDKIVDLGRSQVEANQGHILFPYSLEYYYAQVEAMADKMRSLFEPSHLVMYLPVIIGLCILGLYRWAKPKSDKRAKLVLSLLLLIAGLDLYLVHGNYNPTVSPDHVFPTPGALEFLERTRPEQPFRVTGVNLALMPNSSMLFDLADVRGYDAVSPRRYMELMRLVNGNVRLNHYSLLKEASDSLLDLLNVEYATATESPDTDWQVAYSGGPDMGDLQVYRNPTVMPRAFIVHRAEVVSNAAQSLHRLADPVFDFRTTVLLEGDVQTLMAGLNLPGQAVASEAKITHYAPERVEIVTRSDADGFLVLTDGFDPGWRAKVDGRPVEVFVADHAFRAVALPAGEHSILFFYDPPAVKIGLAISLLAWGAIIVVAIGLMVGHNRPGPEN